MSSSKFIILFSASLLVVLISCSKEEQVEMSDLTGNWIENTPEVYKAELEILPDGTIYITQQDASITITDTGSVTIKGISTLQFDVDTRSLTGEYCSVPKSIDINNLVVDLFPTTTNFIPN